MFNLNVYTIYVIGMTSFCVKRLEEHAKKLGGHSLYFFETAVDSIT